MNRHLEFGREEFRRIIQQVRPEFYDEDHYFLVVEIDGPVARCKVVDRLVTVITSPDDKPEVEAEAEEEAPKPKTTRSRKTATKA